MWVAPVLILSGLFLALRSEATRPAALWLVAEDHPVEQITFACLLAASVLGVAVAWRLHAGRSAPWVWAFFACFGVGMFVLAMEEISWGQRMFGFETPAALRAINRQGETTLHNIGPLQGRSELMRLGFGLAGIGGILVSRRVAYSRVRAPMSLMPWVLVITAHATLDVYNDIFPIEETFDRDLQRTSEVVEMLIGLTVLIYVWRHWRVENHPAGGRR